jgi:ribonuclease HI
MDTLELPLVPVKALPLTGVAVVHFDGGCLRNPGQKYGSFELTINGMPSTKKVGLQFGFGTNNEAEFQALEAGLIELNRLCLADGLERAGFAVKIKTDSTIVRNRIGGPNRIFKKYPESSRRMFDLADRCRKLLAPFGRFEIAWEPRESNVSRFGH